MKDKQLSHQDQVILTECGVTVREKTYRVFGRPMIDLFATKKPQAVPPLRTISRSHSIAKECVPMHVGSSYAFPLFTLIQ